VPSPVRLATDIAAQFAYLPPDEAAARIATHIRTFWERRMREELLAQLGEGDQGGVGLVEPGRADLEPLVRAAAGRLRENS
jgi:formate dehydrogenase subunit delta